MNISQFFFNYYLRETAKQANYLPECKTNYFEKDTYFNELTKNTGYFTTLPSNFNHIYFIHIDHISLLLHFLKPLDS